MNSYFWKKRGKIKRERILLFFWSRLHSCAMGSRPVEKKHGLSLLSNLNQELVRVWKADSNKKDTHHCIIG